MLLCLLASIKWLRIRSPWFWPGLVWYLSGNGKKLDESLSVVKSFTQAVIADRKRLREQRKQQDSINRNTQKEKRKPAFLELLLEMQEVSAIVV